MVVKSEVCEKIGLMDEKLFLYVEEVDWCVRARHAGYKIYFVPDSKVYHKISSSTGEDFGIIFNYFNTRNFLYVIKKNMSFPIREFYLINSIFHKLNDSKGILKEIIKREFWVKGKKTTIKYSKIRGVIDFLTGRMGKGYFENIL
jgi:GT2 family glycosyltransferase